MAATSKPVRKESKKIEMGYNQMDKKDPVLKAYSKAQNKKHHKEFVKSTAELRLGKKK